MPQYRPSKVKHRLKNLSMAPALSAVISWLMQYRKSLSDQAAQHQHEMTRTEDPAKWKGAAKQYEYCSNGVSHLNAVISQLGCIATSTDAPGVLETGELVEEDLDYSPKS
jgi:hypothetical protein